MIRVCDTGKNPTMRYLHRTHRINVAWLHECFLREDFFLVYEKSASMCADISPFIGVGKGFGIDVSTHTRGLFIH